MSNPSFQKCRPNWSIALIKRDVTKFAIIMIFLSVPLFFVSKVLGLEYQVVFPSTLASIVSVACALTLGAFNVTGVRIEGRTLHFDRLLSKPMDMDDIEVVKLEEMKEGYVIYIRNRIIKKQIYRLHLSRSSQE